MRFIAAALILLSAFFTTGAVFLPPVDVQIVNTTVSYQFGTQIDFSAQIQSDQPIQTVYLSFQAEGSDTISNLMQVGETGQYLFTQDVSQLSLHPFSRVYYWFRVLSDDGGDFTSPSYWFDYEDNRFTWQIQENEQFRIHWSDGDSAFGQTVMDTALEGVNSISNLLPVSFSQPVSIYVYPSTADLETVLPSNGIDDISGDVYSSQDVIFVSAEADPNEHLDLENQIPHELGHLALYQMTGENYRKLPGWLVEGVPALAELDTNPDNERILQEASASGKLLSLSSLCSSLPENSEGKSLAYAEAASFTRFIYQNYGKSTLLSLIQGYADGYSCEAGVQYVIGISFDELERDWQINGLGVDPQVAGWEKLTPYFLLMGIVAGIPALILIIRFLYYKREFSLSEKSSNG